MRSVKPKQKTNNKKPTIRKKINNKQTITKKTNNKKVTTKKVTYRKTIYNKSRFTLLPENIKRQINRIPNTVIIDNKNTFNFDKHINQLLNKYYSKFNNISTIYQNVFNTITINDIQILNDFNNKFKTLYPTVVDIIILLHNNNIIQLNNAQKQLFIINNNTQEITNYFNTEEGITLLNTVYNYKNTNDNNIKNLINSRFPNNNFFNHNTNLYYNKFLSYKIQKSLHTDINKYIKIKYSCSELKIYDKVIDLYVSNNFFNKKNINELARLMVARIVFFNKLQKEYGNQEYSKVPNMTIFTSNQKKVMIKDDETIFKEDNVNSAVTNTVDNIIIFREEELLKSILHECIHFHKLDFRFDTYPNQLINQLLNIKEYNLNKNNELRLSEAYCETIANILNIILSLTKLKVSKTKKYTQLNKIQLKSYIKYEMKFSAFQCYKILFFLEKHKIQLTQTSSIFSYYIVKFQLLLNIQELLNKLNKQDLNTTFLINLKFNLTFEEFHNLIAFTNENDKENQKKSILYKKMMRAIYGIDINVMNPIIKNTLRMTCLHF